MLTRLKLLMAIAALILGAGVLRAEGELPLRGDLTRDGFVTPADVIAAEQLFTDPHGFVKANPGWTRESLRHVADTDRNGIVDTRDQTMLRRTIANAISNNGWTPTPLAPGAVAIHASSSQGLDAHHGLSPDQPVATLARGLALLRNGHGDHLLLRAGDTWSEPTLRWRKSGRSDREPMLISVYGQGQRPTLIGSDGHIISFEGHHLRIVGLRMTGAAHGSAVFSFTKKDRPWSDLLIEDCVITYCHDGLNLQNIADAVVRRCIITDTKRQGIFSAHTTNLTIEQNFFNRNGTHNLLDHCLYLSGSSVGTVVRDNLLIGGANFALKFNGSQSQGLITGNVVFATRNGISIGANDPDQPTIDTVVCKNVITEIGREGQSIGLYINHAHRVSIENNLLAHPTQQSEAIRFTGEATHRVANIDQLTLVDNTVYAWPGLLCNTADFSDVTLRHNTFVTAPGRRTPTVVFDSTLARGATFTGNTYAETAGFAIGGSSMAFDQWKAAVEPDAQNIAVTFVDPSRNVTRYAASLGMSVESFLQTAAARARSQWDDRYAAPAIATYIRKGFERQ